MCRSSFDANKATSHSFTCCVCGCFPSSSFCAPSIVEVRSDNSVSVNGGAALTVSMNASSPTVVGSLGSLVLSANLLWLTVRQSVFASVLLVGGGGAGGNSSACPACSNGGGGGGGGAVLNTHLNLTAGMVLQLSVGVGGRVTSANGAPSFVVNGSVTLCQAAGGMGGGAAVTTGGIGGAAGGVGGGAGGNGGVSGVGGLFSPLPFVPCAFGGGGGGGSGCMNSARSGSGGTGGGASGAIGWDASLLRGGSAAAAHFGGGGGGACGGGPSSYVMPSPNYIGGSPTSKLTWTLACSSGQFPVGMSVRYAPLAFVVLGFDWMCASIVNGQTGLPTWSGSASGVNGGGAPISSASYTCPSGSIITGLAAVQGYSGSSCAACGCPAAVCFHDVAIQCASVSPNAVVSSSTSWIVANVSVANPAVGGTANQTVACPPRMFVSSLQWQAGWFLDTVAIATCDYANATVAGTGGSGLVVIAVGSAASTPCAAGSYSSAGASACTVCPAGYMCPFSTVTTPTPCGIGYVSVAGATACSVCPAGNTTFFTGQSRCATCPAGSMCPQQTCAAGTCGSGMLRSQACVRCVVLRVTVAWCLVCASQLCGCFLTAYLEPTPPTNTFPAPAKWFPARATRRPSCISFPICLGWMRCATQTRPFISDRRGH